MKTVCILFINIFLILVISSTKNYFNFISYCTIISWLTSTTKKIFKKIHRLLNFSNFFNGFFIYCIVVYDNIFIAKYSLISILFLFFLLLYLFNM